MNCRACLLIVVKKIKLIFFLNGCWGFFFWLIKFSHNVFFCKYIAYNYNHLNFVYSGLQETNWDTIIDMPSCPICYEETSNPHFCVPCRHIFCYKCISAWRNRTCPLCRGNIASYRPIELASFIENGTVLIDIQIWKFYIGTYVLESHIFSFFYYVAKWIFFSLMTFCPTDKRSKFMG